MLELDAVDIAFGPLRVLNQVHLRLRAGERLGVVGPSGAGKSSLLRLACGLLPPASGTLRNTFRHPVLVFQEPRLLPWRHVRDNVALPLLARGMRPRDACQVAEQWLDRMGLGGFMNVWPAELSGGMAQRVALARALALAPDLLLLDEPFSALDTALRRQLARLCHEALSRRDAAMLCISHDPRDLAGLVDRWLFVDAGGVRLLDTAPIEASQAEHTAT